MHRSLLIDRILIIPLVDKPSALDFSSVRESLAHIVPLCLDSDPSLIPISCGTQATPSQNISTPLPVENSRHAQGQDQDSDDRDPDDFSFWSERQARRICAAIKQIFNVDYAPEVVMADANLTALANRILLSREILTSRNTLPD